MTRQVGKTRLTLILPHGRDAPEQARFPQPLRRASAAPRLSDRNRPHKGA